MVVGVLVWMNYGRGGGPGNQSMADGLRIGLVEYPTLWRLRGSYTGSCLSALLLGVVAAADGVGGRVILLASLFLFASWG